MGGWLRGASNSFNDGIVRRNWEFRAPPNRPQEEEIRQWGTLSNFFVKLQCNLTGIINGGFKGGLRIPFVNSPHRFSPKLGIPRLALEEAVGRDSVRVSPVEFLCEITQ